MITERALGICPACNQSVFATEDPDDCYSICPCDLGEKNPYHQVSELAYEVSQAQIKDGDYSNCPSRHGMYCDIEDIPMHAACLDKEY